MRAVPFTRRFNLTGHKNMSSTRKLDTKSNNMDIILRQTNPVDIFLGKPGFASVDREVTGKNLHAPSHRNKNMGLDRGDDLYQSLRFFLLFGRFIGLIPIQGLFQTNVQALRFCKSSLSILVSISIWGLLGASAVVGCIGMGSMAMSADNAGHYALAPATYYYFYKHSQQLINLLSKWNSLTLTLELTQPDLNLFRDVSLIAGFILTSAIFENAVGHIKLFPVFNNSGVNKTSSGETSNSAILEIYYINTQTPWAALVPYSAPIALYCFFCNKLALYSWNFMDCLISSFSRALYFKFKALYQKGKLSLFDGSSNSRFDTTKWRRLTADHEALCKMLSEMNEFLSPLIFLSFALNIYFVCLQINLGLKPSANNSTIASVYAIWSFVHLVCRLYIVSLTGSRINDWAHKIGDLCRTCPNEAYTIEVERMERFEASHQIGLSGLGCFCITKPLMLQIVGVVLTFEIVLLQANQTPTTTAAH